MKIDVSNATPFVVACSPVAFIAHRIFISASGTIPLHYEYTIIIFVRFKFYQLIFINSATALCIVASTKQIRSRKLAFSCSISFYLHLTRESKNFNNNRAGSFSVVFAARFSSHSGNSSELRWNYTGFRGSDREVATSGTLSLSLFADSIHARNHEEATLRCLDALSLLRSLRQSSQLSDDLRGRRYILNFLTQEFHFP